MIASSFETGLTTETLAHVPESPGPSPYTHKPTKSFQSAESRFPSVRSVVGVVSQESKVVLVQQRWPLESCSCYRVGLSSLCRVCSPTMPLPGSQRDPRAPYLPSYNAGVPEAACLLVAGGFMVIYWGFFISPWSAINIFIPPE